MGFADIITSTYNSTLGLPGQVIMRILRAIKDDDIDLLSEDGLLDAALIPGFGVFADHSKDAYGKDITGSAGSGFALDLLLDPLTYMASPLSVAGKASKATTKAMQVMGKTASASKGETVASAVAHAERLLLGEGAQAVGQKGAKTLRTFIDDFGKHEGTVGDIIRHGGETELALGLPFLPKMSAPKIVTDNFKSWAGLMLAPNKVYTKVGGLALEGMKGIPHVGPLVDKASSVAVSMMKGLKTPRQFGVTMGKSYVTPAEAQHAGDMLTDSNKTLRETIGQMGPDQLVSDFAAAKRAGEDLKAADLVEAAGNALKAGDQAPLAGWGDMVPAGMGEAPYMRVQTALLAGDTKKAKRIAAGFIGKLKKGGTTLDHSLLTTFKIPIGSKSGEAIAGEAQALLRQLSGGREVASLQNPDQFGKLLDSFSSSFDEAWSLTTKAEAGGAGVAAANFADAAFNFGQRVRGVWYKGFKASSGIETALQYEKAYRSDLAKMSERAQQFTAELSEKMVLATKHLGEGGREKGLSILRNHAEGVFGEELPSILNAAQRGDPQAINALGTTMSRMQGAADGMRKAATDMGLTEFADEMVLFGDELSEAGLRFYSDKGFKNIWKQLHGEVPPPHALGPQQYKLLSGKKAEQRWLGFLSDAELEASFSRLNRLDPKKMRAKEWSDLEQVKHLRELRSGRHTAAQFKPFPVPKGKSHLLDKDFGARTFEQAARDSGGMFASSPFKTKLGKRFKDMALAMSTIEAEANLLVRGAPISSEAIMAFRKASEGYSSLMGDMLRNAMGPEFGGVLDGMAEMRKVLTRQAIDLGLPLQGAYVGRIISGTGRQALSRLENAGGIGPGVGKGIGQYAGEFGRGLNHLSLDELNGLYMDALEAGNKEVATTMKQILEKEGLKLTQYEDDPILAMGIRLGQLGQQKSTRDFVDAAIHSDPSVLRGGKVIGYYDRGGKQYAFDGAKRAGFESKGRYAELDITEIEFQQNIRGAIVERSDGTHELVSAAQFSGHSGLGIVPLGEGATVGEALAHNAFESIPNGLKMSGTLDQGMNLGQLANLSGKQILYGNTNAIQGMQNMVGSTYKAVHPAVQAFDQVNYFLRKFQTVYRPAFAAANVVSGAFQGSMLGTSVKSNVRGHMLASRVLFGFDSTALNQLDNFHAVVGKSELLRVNGAGMQWADNARDFLSTVRRGNLDQNALDDIAHGVIDLGDGRRIPFAKFIDAASKGDLFGSFYSRAFGGAGTVTEGARRAVSQATKGSKASKLRGIPELSETYSRLSVLLGQVYDGIPLSQAVSRTKDAMVDYTQLTNFERALKRGIMYFTFPRHYTPFALEQFAKSPRGLGVTKHMLQDSGALTYEGGKLQLKVGKWRIAAQRMNANLDAAMLLPALLQSVGVGNDLEPSISQPGVGTMGGMASVLGMRSPMEGDSAFNEGNMLDRLVSSTFLGRWVVHGGDALLHGAGDRSIGEEAAKFLLPVREVDYADHEKRVLKARYNELLGYIKSQARKTTSARRRGYLQQQAKDLSKALRALSDREAEGFLS